MDPRGSRTHAVPEASLLTPREWQIVVLIALGYTIEEIADRQALATSAVAGHISAVLWKLGSSDLLDVVQRIVDWVN
jgi:DNA-binding NarL/FixJ family response regulator